MNRNKVYLGNLPENDQEFVDINPAERVSFIWELNAEIWSLRKPDYVKRRLQRNIVYNKAVSILSPG